MKRTVAVTVFLVLPATLDGRKVQITKSALVGVLCIQKGHLLNPGSDPNTCIMYMPHLNHMFDFEGRSESAIIPVNAGMRATIIMKTLQYQQSAGASRIHWDSVHRKFGFLSVINPTIKNQQMLRA